MKSHVFLAAIVALLGVSTSANAQDHDHAAHDAGVMVEPPKVFLDKSPRIVEYQLKRLDNQRLLMVERKTDDKKYIPVYEAILTRGGMSPQFREESLEALVKLRQSDPVIELLSALSSFAPDDREQARTARQVAGMLLMQPTSVLVANADAFVEATEDENELVRQVGHAGLIVSGAADTAWAKATDGKESTLDWLFAIRMIPYAEMRAILRENVVSLIDQSKAVEVRRAAVDSIAFVPGRQDETFDLVAPLVSDAKFQVAAVRTLLAIPKKVRGARASGEVLRALVEHAEKTPAKDRTTGAFVDAMQLADQLMTAVPSDLAKSYRARLSAVTVRVVRIKTVEEEMRYDIPFFAVQAGKTVQVVVENHDLMPHNLVITAPGALKEVAQLGLEAGPRGGWKGLQYVPESDKVLQATQMIPANQNERLTFTAPTEPGEYPYVCTFPQHWYRIYGVMVVVVDLDASTENPVEPANPIGSNRSFVRAWKLDDLKDELDAGLRGRTAEIGKRIFAEASCLGCHKIKGEGGIIGPELTDVVERWKGDRVGILREILEPSHKVDAKYTMQQILTVDGRTLSGVLIKQDDDTVTILSSPEAKEPTVIPQDDIEAMVPSPNSIMPKALMDQYTKDEIFELMGYLESIAKQAP